VVTTYDRSDLIHRAINTLKEELTLGNDHREFGDPSLSVAHPVGRSFPSVTIPISVCLAFIPMYFMGLTTNIMSLAGIAISIGVLVDGAIVEVENAYKRLEEWIEGGRQGRFSRGASTGAERSGAVRVFSPFGHRHRVLAGLYVGGSGGTVV
jgi:Cu(I)/Ag(I) efflux system membrane protein CusA/SilA